MATNMKPEIREYTTVDKSKWGNGAWQDEPDKIQWVDEATNLDCLMHRHLRSGHWCGYVGVAEGHPYFGVGYSECTRQPKCEESYCDHAPNVDVHGGLTYADFCQDTKDESHGICHLPFEGRPHRVWWFGFDCAQSGDASPGIRALLREFPSAWDRDEWETYRDRAYVEREVRNLAAQLAGSGVSPLSEAQP